MKAQVQQWGDRLAVCIPDALAAELGVGAGAALEVSIMGGALVLRPLAEGVPTLEALLAGVTPENAHAEVDMGKAVGKEIF